MVGVIFVVIALIALYFFGFQKANTKQKSDLFLEGGMLIKYAELVRRIQSTDSGLSYSQITDTHAIISGRGKYRSITYDLIHAFDKIHIKWNMTDPMLGNFNLDWKFDNGMGQDVMFANIQDGMRRFRESMANRYENQ